MYPNDTILPVAPSTRAASNGMHNPIYQSVWLALLQQIRRRQRLRAWLNGQSQTRHQGRLR
jgi:hypothetical protein